MATFLSTSKMNPALAARVERAVGGRQGSALVVRRIVSIARLALVLAVAFGIYSVLQGRKQQQRELEQARTSLLETVSVKGAAVSIEDRAVVTRSESSLMPVAGELYEGDLVADELRAPGALATMLASRPSLYVRGPIQTMKTGPRIAETASKSTKDSLLLCMLEPPTSRTEKVLLDKVRVAYLGGATMDQRTANVHRLNDAIVGLKILLPEWSDRVRKAPDAVELTRLRTELEHAPIERTKAAASAGLLLMAIDEPGEGTGPTELDGERPHAIRIALVDLTSSKVLLRLRMPVDPSWISPSRRPTYASGLDACAFAFDVHARAAK